MFIIFAAYLFAVTIIFGFSFIVGALISQKTKKSYAFLSFLIAIILSCWLYKSWFGDYPYLSYLLGGM